MADTRENENQVEVAIIGAGFSGLLGAHYLKEAGFG